MKATRPNAADFDARLARLSAELEEIRTTYAEDLASFRSRSRTCAVMTQLLRALDFNIHEQVILTDIACGYSLNAVAKEHHCAQTTASNLYQRFLSQMNDLVTLKEDADTLRKKNAQLIERIKELRPTPKPDPSDPTTMLDPKLLDYKLADLGISVRAYNGAASLNVYTLGELASCTVKHVLTSKYIGRATLQELHDLLTRYHLTFGMDLTGYGITAPKVEEELRK